INQLDGDAADTAADAGGRYDMSASCFCNSAKEKLPQVILGGAPLMGKVACTGLTSPAEIAYLWVTKCILTPYGLTRPAACVGCLRPTDSDERVGVNPNAYARRGTPRLRGALPPRLGK